MRECCCLIVQMWLLFNSLIKLIFKPMLLSVTDICEVILFLLVWVYLSCLLDIICVCNSTSLTTSRRNSVKTDLITLTNSLNHCRCNFRSFKNTLCRLALLFRWLVFIAWARSMRVYCTLNTVTVAISNTKTTNCLRCPVSHYLYLVPKCFLSCRPLFQGTCSRNTAFDSQQVVNYF
jgi:hypothetical protein